MTLIHFFTHTELAFKTLFKFSAPKSTGPSKCHANFELDFSFLNFFLAFKFFSWLFPDFFSTFFWTFFSTFLPTFSWLNFLDFFHCWSHTSKARSDSWLCNYDIYRWKCNSVQFDLPTFLSYNKAMLSQEIVFGNEFQRDLAACRVSPLFLHKVCGIWRAFLIFVVLVGEETIVTPRGCCRCTGIALRGCESQGLRTLWDYGQGGL